MLCPACHAEASVEFFSKNGKTLLVCEKCRHVSWREMPSPETLSEFYSAQYTEQHGQDAVQSALIDYYKGHAAELANALGKPAKKLAIADVGCSLPVFLEQAKAAGFRQVLGVDYSNEAATYGKARGVDVITPEAFAELPDDSFDVLRYSHALEHMIDPREVLVSQIRKLRPGGLLYITQPNFPVFKAGPGGDIKDSVWPTHLHFFNPISLRAIVEEAGAKEIRFYTVGDPEGAAELYRPFLDIEYAKHHMHDLADIGEPARGVMSNFPDYAGENSALFALKQAQGPTGALRDIWSKARLSVGGR